MDRVNLLIDADTAGDDATSLLIGCRHAAIQLVAVTVCGTGNVNLDQAVRNTLYTLQRAGRCDVPVYAGASEAMQQRRIGAEHVHGSDGMGDSNFPRPSYANLNTEEAAADALVRLTAEQPGQLAILAQGPLTNIANAVRKHDEFASNTSVLYIMGGNYKAAGNQTAHAEYNFYADPEAAQTVLNAGFRRVLIVDWGVCLRDGLLDMAYLDSLQTADTDLAKFFLDANRGNIQFCQKHGIDGCVASDSLVTALIAQPSINVAWIPCYAQVDVGQSSTRGMTIVDEDDKTKQANVHFSAGIDGQAYRRLLYTILTSSV